MQLHQLKPKTKNKTKKRVGRGGKRGTYSGRGIKGQKSRAGHSIRPHIRDVIKKIPKKRGYDMPRFGEKPEVVNVGELDRAFKEGAVVNPKTLAEKSLINLKKGRKKEVKILGSGQIKKKITVKNCQLSESAKKKIEEAGGIIEFKVKNENEKKAT